MHYLEKENVFWSGNVWPQAYAMQAGFRARLVSKKFGFCPSHRIFGRMHGALNIDEKKLITQFGEKLRDETFEPN